MIDNLVRVSLNCQFERKALPGELCRSMVVCLDWQLMQKGKVHYGWLSTSAGTHESYKKDS